jgi:hypothetical protein
MEPLVYKAKQGPLEQQDRLEPLEQQDPRVPLEQQDRSEPPDLQVQPEPQDRKDLLVLLVPLDKELQVVQDPKDQLDHKGHREILVPQAQLV